MVKKSTFAISNPRYIRPNFTEYMRLRILGLLMAMIIFVNGLNAQDTRTQYPGFLANAYFGVNFGYMGYPFTSEQLEPGYTTDSIRIPHLGIRVLIGYSILPNLSAQISYMRPMDWVEYTVNGQTRSVYMNFGGLTVKYRHKIGKKLSVFAEGGLGIVTRSGFKIDDNNVVTDASFSTLQGGLGLDYHINNKWDLSFTSVFTGGEDDVKQPASTFFSAGFRYNMRPLSQEKVEANAKSGYFFPKHTLQLGYTTNAFGYGVNEFLNKDLHIFWGGDVQVEKGISLHYLRNVFHTNKVFALDIGGGFSWWQSEINKDQFITLSLMPVMRFNVVRTKPVDFYLFYSIAGPTYISKTVIDDQITGKHFTFMDYMGIGIFAGKKRNFNAEVNVNHYSNGNIYSQNPGLMIPLTFNIGYSW